MDVNSIQFISHRDSIASNFAQQTQNSSSMLSSRRRLHDDEEENDLEDFKEQIQFKFIRSVANKMYTYPLSQQAFDLFGDEEEFSDLVGVTEYNLFEQEQRVNPDGFKKQQFKIKNGKPSSKTALLLLQALKSQRQRIYNLRALISETAQLKNQKKQLQTLYTDTIEQSNRQIMQQDSHIYRKKRLNTEPYEKPMGFIIKKK